MAVLLVALVLLAAGAYAAFRGYGPARDAWRERAVEQALARFSRTRLERVDDDPDRRATLEADLAALAAARGFDEIETVEEETPDWLAEESTEELSAAPAAAPEESITSVQVAGMDEGDIVKALGERLVVLRRGRVFTLAPPTDGTSELPVLERWWDLPEATYWDEMLVRETPSGGEVIVLGLGEDGSQIVRLDPTRPGADAIREHVVVPSGDYYSSRDYATRARGDHLYLYAIEALGDRELALPSFAIHHHGASDEPEAIVRDRAIYAPLQPTIEPTLHTWIDCDLSATPMTCGTRSVIGPSERVLYVSSTAAYLWIAGAWGAPDSTILYRLPLDGSAPGALRVSGSPIDAHSFDEHDGRLDVLVLADSRGSGMWGADRAAGDAALLSVAISTFSPAVETPEPAAWRPLPRAFPAPRDYGDVQQRFVGDHLVYGDGETAATDAPFVVVVDRATGHASTLPLEHRVDRIEAMGPRAVVIGGEGTALCFTVIDLEGTPHVVATHREEDASQGDSRSHGFSYRTLSDGSHVVGLPLLGASGGSTLARHAARIVFLSADDAGTLARLGDLAASTGELGDRCVISCDDWYGNSRPIVWRSHLFALMGYELVLGSIENAALVERGRTTFLPESLHGPPRPRQWVEE